MLPLLLRNKVKVAGSENRIYTRQAGKIVLRFRRTRNAQKTVFYEGIKLCNSLRCRIRKYDKLNVFKRELILGGQHNILSSD